MSGFVGGGAYELTATKAEYWHRFCRCGRRTPAEIIRGHVVPAGFDARPGRGGRFWRITGPGLEDGNTNALYMAVSGRPEQGAAMENARQVALIASGETFAGHRPGYRRGR